MPGEWDAQHMAWEARVRLYGVERASGNASHKTSEQRAAFDRIQRAAVLPLLRAATARTPASSALDFGCGLGRWSATLSALCGSCVGVDPTMSIILSASANSPGASVRFHHMTGGRIPIRDACVDVVFSCLVLNTILSASMLEATASEFARVLRPGGLLFVVDLTARPGPALGRWSLSRSVEAYRQALAGVAPLRLLGEYMDGPETHSILAGRRRVVVDQQGQQ